MRGRRRLLPALILALLLIGVGVKHVVYPVITAGVCPLCYGLHRAGPSVWTDRGGDDEIVAARQRVRDWFGDLRSDPRFLVCHDTACSRRLGGHGEKGKTIRRNVIALSPDGANETIASHELTHAEMYARLDDYGGVPHWFHEGLAVVVSQDARYLPCPVDYAGALQRIRDRSSAGQDFYRDSACVADHWVTEHGGKPAVLDLITRLNHGDPFTAVVALH